MRGVTTRLRFTDAHRRRLAVAAKALKRAAHRALETIVTPDTLLRWYARLVAQKYDGSRQRKCVGRPPKSAELRDLVVRLARENSTWGYTRIRGQLSRLGHRLGRSTIARMLADAGIEPSPNRPVRWREFLQAHLGHVFAADFFTVEVLTLTGLADFGTGRAPRTNTAANGDGPIYCGGRLGGLPRLHHGEAA